MKSRWFFLAAIFLIFFIPSYSQENSGLSSQSDIANVNPYSRAIGQKIAGSVLTGLGAADITIGLIFDSNDLFVKWFAQNNPSVAGPEDALEKLTWIGGIVEAGIGIPLVIMGSIQNSKWKKWQQEHGNVVSFDGTKLTVYF